jgi:hypothetical protein
VIKDLKSNDIKSKRKHIKDDFTPQTGESVDEWVSKYDFTTDIANLVQITKCLYNTQF